MWGAERRERTKKYFLRAYFPCAQLNCQKKENAYAPVDRLHLVVFKFIEEGSFVLVTISIFIFDRHGNLN